jgi:hypothetical protein
MKSSEPRVELLYFDGCPNHHPTEELIREVLLEEGLQPQLVRVPVETPDAALRERFLGSPTIRINGKDIDPEGDDGQYALRCRVYLYNNRLSGAPDKEMVRRALRKSTA